METVVPIPALPTVPVHGASAVFPVRRIYCIGRNYADHAREMGADPNRETPFFFGKPQDVVVPQGGKVAYPPATSNLHHEVELVVALTRGGRDIPEADALACIYGYAVGLDLTRRDLQAKAKDKGQPWDTAKGFDQSAPLGAIVERRGSDLQGAIRLDVNDATRQASQISNMIWSVPEIIAECSRLWCLAPGDLIFTGTPEGVGPLVPGDRVRAAIDGLPELTFTLA